MELAYSLLFALPGAPVLRYGEEIGMGEDLRLGPRRVRTPMQWSPERNGGFSRRTSRPRPRLAGPWLAARERRGSAPRSATRFLSWTDRMIRMRKQCPEIGWGQWKVLGTGGPKKAC